MRASESFASRGARGCPECGKEVPEHAGYLPWCECGWNLEPRDTEEVSPAARRAGKAIFENVLAHGATRPRFGFGDVCVAAISSCVILVFPVSLCVAVLLPWMAPGVVGAWIGGAFALLLALWFVPRVVRLDEGERVTRAEAPRLFELLDDVAEALGIVPVERVYVGAGWNAFVTRVGWRSERALWIGLPLFLVLGPQQRVALVAHELSHLANGDLTRSAWVARALVTLDRSVDLLSPETVEDLPTQVVVYVASLPPRLLRATMMRVYFRKSQRAEYYADRLGARVAGTEGMALLLCDLEGEAVLEYAVQLLHSGRSQRSLVEELRWQWQRRPVREQERCSRVSRLEGHRVDGTHPPSAERIRMLLERPVEHAGVRCGEERGEAVVGELVELAGERVEWRLLRERREEEFEGAL